MVFDCYNVELGSRKIKSLKLENASNTYSSFNEIKFDIDDAHDKFLLYKQFIERNSNACCIAPLSDYPSYEAYQELPRFKHFFSGTDEKLYIDLRSIKGYTNKLENLSRDDSDLSLTTMLKNSAT